MGIPSYFSHIIRNYSNIIRSLKYFSEWFCEYRTFVHGLQFYRL